MIFHRFVDPKTSTYTYLLANRKGADAIIIDSVQENVEEYLQFIGRHQLRLAMAIDTHMHADHTTGMGALRDHTGCMTVGHKLNQAAKLSWRVEDGDKIQIEGIELKVIHTPGHTDDSCCFYEETYGMLFTGDTLLIRGCGRTDFANGDPEDLYHSITEKIYALPGSTHIYSGHDYKGETISTIDIEREENPRLTLGKEKFIEIMGNLNLPQPEQMDVAVPANRNMGQDLDTKICETMLVDHTKLDQYVNNDEVTIVDLRSTEEIAKSGTLPKIVNIPYLNIDKALDVGGEIYEALKADKKVLFVCAYGERSALALQKVPMHLSEHCFHLKYGIESLKAEGYPLTQVN